MSLRPGEVIAPPYANWRANAACRNEVVSTEEELDPYFSTDKDTVRAVKLVCRICPVRDECLRYALAWGERYGVWGGESWPRRHALAREFHGTPEHWQTGCRCPHCEEAQARRREIARYAEALG